MFEQKKNFLCGLGKMNKQQVLLLACGAVRTIINGSGDKIDAVERIACERPGTIPSDAAKFATIACDSAAASVAHPPGLGRTCLDPHVDWVYGPDFYCSGDAPLEEAIKNALSCIERAADSAATGECVFNVEWIHRTTGKCYQSAANAIGYLPPIVDCETWDAAHNGKREWIQRLIDVAYRDGIPFPDEWMTTDALSIAQQIFADREFAHMPILGDALEDAGCADDELLSHLRNDRGLWGRSDWVVFNLVCKGES